MAEANLSPVGLWDALNADRFYAREQLGPMQWADLRLDEMRVACAAFGGPIAMVRDEAKATLVRGASTTAPVVRTFTAAGRPLGAFAWEGAPIAALGWTDEQDLMILQESGEVRLYSMFGQRLPGGFSLGEEVARDGVERAELYGGGLVVLTRRHALWAVTSLAEPRPQRFAVPPMSDPPHAMALLEPQHTLSGCLEVLLAVDNTVFVVDAGDAADQGVNADGPLLRLAPALGGKFLAGLTAAGRLVVWLADFTKVLTEFDPPDEAVPQQIAWCGSDALVVKYEDSILVVGPLGDTIQYPVPPETTLVTEVDGVRLVSDGASELLRGVPDALADVYRVGSTAPGAVLYDARQLFDGHNAKADVLLRSVAEALPDAVATCLDAAGADLSPLRQAALLKAAVYGRAFVAADAFPKDGIISVARKLRILNALREAEVGIPLTMAQLDRLTVPALAARLVHSRHHLLALRVCQMMGLPTDQVLVDWACAKVSASSDMPDGALRAQLDAKLAGRAGIRYAAIATHAQAIGRKSLATLLLDSETCAAEQVPLLLSLGEGERGLTKALASGDADLVHLALFHLHRALPLADFQAVLAARPAARRLFEKYCRSQDPELLEQMLTMSGRPEGVAALRLAAAVRLNAEALRPPGGAKDSKEAVRDANRLLDKAAELYGQTKEHAFQSKATAEYARLRTVQAELEIETGNACFLGLSVVDTLRQCIRLGNARAAARVRSEFKVSDKRFYWIKLRALAAAKDWDGLDALVSERRPPTGLPPFIAAARANGAPKPVLARLIARLPDAKRQAEEYAASGMYQEAAETAAQARDGDMLSKIQAMVGAASPLGLAVSQIKGRLQIPLRPS